MAAPYEARDDSATPGKSSGPILAALRRWPLLLLGAAVGLIAGFFCVRLRPKFLCSLSH